MTESPRVSAGFGVSPAGGRCAANSKAPRTNYGTTRRCRGGRRSVDQVQRPDGAKLRAGMARQHCRGARRRRNGGRVRRRARGSDRGLGYLALGWTLLAAGDVAAARNTLAAAYGRIPDAGWSATNLMWRAETELAANDLVAARLWADQAVSATAGYHRTLALNTHARVVLPKATRRASRRPKGTRTKHWRLRPIAGHGWACPTLSKILRGWPPEP